LYHHSPEKKHTCVGSFDEALKFYIERCDKYRCSPHVGVIVALRFKTSTFKASRDFSDIDMLALADLMLKYPGEVEHIQVIDLSYSKVAVHGTIALAEVLRKNHNIRSVHLHGLRISSMGAEALAHALGSYNRSVEYVNMRACRIGQAGGRHLASLVLSNENSRIREMDLSVNNIGIEGLMALRDANKRRELKRNEDNKIVSTVLDLEGNLVLEEVLNSATHGVGIILGCVGTMYLVGRASEYGIVEYVAAAMYSCTLLLLYTSSTLYHAFFCCKATNQIFQVIAELQFI